MEKSLLSKNSFPNELKILEHILRGNLQSESFVIRSIGEVGYVLESSKNIWHPDYNACLFDYDDTLVGTTVVKVKRDELFLEHLKARGITIDDIQAKSIMKITDIFSRWKEKATNKEIYHGNAHMAALAWSVKQLIAKKTEFTVEEIIQYIKETLERIRKQLEGIDTFQKEDPFRIRDADSFVLNGMEHMWPKEIAGIALLKTMINPPHYLETIDAARIISDGRHDHSINLGIFTFGDPKYQLPKVLKLMQIYPDLAVSEIWLTRIPKGEFLIKIREQYLTSCFAVVDDSPKELEVIARAHTQVPNNIHLVAVRSTRPGAKECCSIWSGADNHLVLDFNESLSASEVAKLLIQKINF